MDLIKLEEKDYKEFTINNNAHFLQSFEWGEVSKYRGYNVYYLGLIDNDEIKASALVLEKKLLLNYKKIYIPRGYTIDYSNESLLLEMTKELKKYAKYNKVIFIRIDPPIKLHTIDKNASIVKGENNYKLVDYLKKIGYLHLPLNKYFESSQPRFTFRIPLSNSFEEIENKFSNTTKSRIKKAISREVYVEKGNKNDIKEFIRLMKLTEQRQNFYSHDDNFYNKFYDIFSSSNMVTLYLGKINLKKLNNKLKIEKKNYLKKLYSIKNNSKKNNNLKKEILKNINNISKELIFLKNKPLNTIVVSSYLIVKYNGYAWALYAANDMKYKNMYANYLVYKTQIEDSFKEGLKVFDVFGTIGDPNSNNHLSGLHEFKRKWGGEYIEFIGEFDLVINKFLYILYKLIIPWYHKIVNKRLKKDVK